MTTAHANVNSQLELLLKGAVDVIRADDLRERLAGGRSRRRGRSPSRWASTRRPRTSTSGTPW